MFLGLSTFEWIVVILLILILVSVWLMGFMNDDGSERRANGTFSEVLSVGRSVINVSETVDDLGKESANQNALLSLIASHMKLALPTHGISILDLKPKLMEKLSQAEIVYIFDLKNWLEDGERKEIPGIGDKEFGKIQDAVDKYLGEYNYVEVS